MNNITIKALSGLAVGVGTTTLKHYMTQNKTPIINRKNWQEKCFNQDTFNLLASTIVPMFFKSTPVGLGASFAISGLLHYLGKNTGNISSKSDDKKTKELEVKHKEAIEMLNTYQGEWRQKPPKDQEEEARFGGKNFWNKNKEKLSKMGLETKDFYTDYKMPGKISAEAFHDKFMYNNTDKVFNAIIDYNPELKKLYETLSKTDYLKITLSKESFISGVACKFTIEDIKHFFVNGYIQDKDYPDNIREWNGFDKNEHGNMASGVTNTSWADNTYLGQHNWSPCPEVIDIIDKAISKLPKTS